MRKIEIIHDKITLTDDVEIVYEKKVTSFGTSAKLVLRGSMLEGKHM